MNDSIDRQMAIDSIKYAGKIGKLTCIDILKRLPSAQPDLQECEKCIFKPFKQFQPERKSGKWEMKWHRFFKREVPTCSVCKAGNFFKTNSAPTAERICEVKSMTRGEALKKMQAVKSYMTSGNPIWSVTEIGEAFDMAIEALEQPERKKGRMIVKAEGLTHYYICDQCGASIDPDDNYCRKCGAEIGG